jgi:hypothetical protein
VKTRVYVGYAIGVVAIAAGLVAVSGQDVLAANKPANKWFMYGASKLGSVGVIAATEDECDRATGAYIEAMTALSQPALALCSEMKPLPPQVKDKDGKPIQFKKDRDS